MLLTIALVLVAMLALAALEVWLFWRLGERGGLPSARAGVRRRLNASRSRRSGRSGRRHPLDARTEKTR
jgi:hypothetical protein